MIAEARFFFPMGWLFVLSLALATLPDSAVAAAPRGTFSHRSMRKLKKLCCNETGRREDPASIDADPPSPI
jgi:hypothetical protein